MSRRSWSLKVHDKQIKVRSSSNIFGTKTRYKKLVSNCTLIINNLQIQVTYRKTMQIKTQRYQSIHGQQNSNRQCLECTKYTVTNGQQQLNNYKEGKYIQQQKRQIFSTKDNKRSDNTIKNHFYSTIRRSLRRMSKLVGEKNSTRQLKYIKPSTLSKIFAINTKPATQQQIQEQKRKCEQNQSYKRLVQYLSRECSQLTDVIMQFSTYKPKGKNCTIAQQKRGRFQAVLEKMQTLKQLSITKTNYSQLYQHMREQQRKLSSLNRPILHDDDDDQSQQQQNSMQEQQLSLNNRHHEGDKNDFVKKNNKNKNNNNRQQQKQDNILINMKKVTRSRRQVRAPKKYYQPQQHINKKVNKINNMTKKQKQTIGQQKQQQYRQGLKYQQEEQNIIHINLKDNNNKSNNNNKSSDKIIAKAMIIDNNNNNINNNNDNDNQIQKVQHINAHQPYQQKHQYQQQQQIQQNANYQQPQFQLSLIHANINSPSQLDHHFPTPTLQLAQTPSYSLPTSFYLNTPALQLYQTPPNVISSGSRGLFTHIQGTWNIRNGQLDDMVSSLGSQIAKNTSQLREKDDNKVIVSNINCSPNSAFRTCQ